MVEISNSVVTGADDKQGTSTFPLVARQAKIFCLPKEIYDLGSGPCTAAQIIENLDLIP